jgi:hydrogenase large subunit
MPTKITIDPVTRLEGHLKVEVTVDTVQGRQLVVDARATGTLFRGFETILKNRDPLDAPDLTQRICGVCPVSHGTAASLALEAAAKMIVPENARIMRNLVLGANYLQSHILHFYHLTAMDFVEGPDMPPWQPSWSADKARFSPSEAALLVEHYKAALVMRRKAHELGALFGGKLPHPPAFVPGGFTTTPRSTRISKFKTLLAEITNFITGTYIPDVELLAARFSDYYEIGKGSENLLAFGVFDLDPYGNSKLLKRGRVVKGSNAAQSVDVKAITEQVAFSWYNDSTANLNPASGATTPVYPKPNAYSWLKAPRYSGVPYETGPLARMTVNGDYWRGISALDRHLARAQEAHKVADAMMTWVAQLSPTGPVYQTYTTPSTGSGIGLTEAPRGALGHWVRIASGRIGNYQVITPTCWNASPRDAAKIPGPLEQALVGTPVQSLAEPVEVLRVVHSFDPCLSCAVHVARPKEGVRIFALSHAG